MTTHTTAAPEGAPRIRALLFDRDGTLVVDVPYNADPGHVRPMPHALAAVRLARRAGARVGVATNQSGVGRSILARRDVRAVDLRIDALFGGFDVWEVCPHAPEAGCECRKPRPGLDARLPDRGSRRCVAARRGTRDGVGVSVDRRSRPAREPGGPRAPRCAGAALRVRKSVDIEENWGMRT